MPEVEVDHNEKPSDVNRFHHMIISCKNVLKMDSVEVSKKRKFQTDQSELSLLHLSKHACFANVACSGNTNGSLEIDTEYHACFANVACSGNTNGSLEIDTEYSMSYKNSTASMECNNEVEMKEESSGSCGGDEMNCSESHLDFIYGSQKDYSEKDIENILYLDEDEEAKGCSNAAKFVLSSGRWTVNQESTLHDTKKPTIDQEFEQYFATLML